MKKVIKYLVIIIAAFLLGYYSGPTLVNFGARTVIPLWNMNELNVEVSAASLTDATTTPFAVQNPFEATSTVDILIFDITTAATSTIDITCGTSTSAFLSPSDTLLDNVAVSTSTKATLVNNCDAMSCPYSGGTNTKERIQVGPTEWVSCLISDNGGLGSTAGITDGGNSFDGNYVINWITNN